MPQSSSPVAHAIESPPVLLFARPLFSGLVAALVLVTLVLLLRRLSGALDSPLAFSGAAVAGLLIGVSTWLLRRAAEAVALSERWRQTMITIVAVVTWITVVSLTLPGTPALAVLALWLPVIASEAAWQVLPRGEQGGRGGVEEQGSRGAGEQGRVEGTRVENAPPALPEGVVQQLTRVQRDGFETIQGVARMNFAEGEQTAALHLAFCPPLAADPQITVQPLDGAGASVKATDCRSYGVRLEGKRDRASSGAYSLLVRLEARTRSDQS